jgi:hypothetical protein
MGMAVMLFVVRNSLVKRKSQMLCCCNARAKVGVKSSHIFTQLLYNVTAICGTDILVCQDNFFLKLRWKEIMNMLLAAHLSPAVQIPCSRFLPWMLVLILVLVCPTFSEIWTKSDAYLLLDPSRNRRK